MAGSQQVGPKLDHCSFVLEVVCLRDKIKSNGSRVLQEHKVKFHVVQLREVYSA